MRQLVPGLLVGVFVATMLNWCRYYFGDKPANYIVILSIFLTGYLLVSYFKLRTSRIHPWIAFLCLLGMGFFIYFSEALLIRKDGAIFLMLIIGTLMLHQLRNEQIDLKFLPGLLLGILVILFPASVAQIILCFVLALSVWASVAFNLFTKWTLSAIVIFAAILYYQLPYFASQSRVSEKIISEKYDHDDHLVITSVKGNTNYFLNKKRFMSSAEALPYMESMTLPFLENQEGKNNVMVLGGENGIVISGLKQFRPYTSIECFTFRPVVLQGMLQSLNEYVPSSSGNVTVHTIDNADDLMENTWDQSYDLIFVDPLRLSKYDYSPLYSQAFLEKLYQLLPVDGHLIVKGFNDDIYTSTNQLIINTLKSLKRGKISSYQYPMNTGGMVKWYVLSKRHLTLPKQFSMETSTEWITSEALNWISKTGKQNYPIHDLIHTHENQYLHQLMVKDALNAQLNL